MYEKLFSRGKIGNLELKSRIVMPPMGTSMACANGEASPEIIRYYEERAKAGCALICTEITCVDEETGAGGFYQLHATSPKYVQSLKSWQTPCTGMTRRYSSSCITPDARYPPQWSRPEK